MKGKDTHMTLGICNSHKKEKKKKVLQLYSSHFQKPFSRGGQGNHSTETIKKKKSFRG